MVVVVVVVVVVVIDVAVIGFVVVVVVVAAAAAAAAAVDVVVVVVRPERSHQFWVVDCWARVVFHRDSVLWGGCLRPGSGVQTGAPCHSWHQHSPDPDPDPGLGPDLGPGVHDRVSLGAACWRPAGAVEHTGCWRSSPGPGPDPGPGHCSHCSGAVGLAGLPDPTLPADLASWDMAGEMSRASWDMPVLLHRRRREGCSGSQS